MKLEILWLLCNKNGKLCKGTLYEVKLYEPTVAAAQQVNCVLMWPDRCRIGTCRRGMTGWSSWCCFALRMTTNSRGQPPERWQCSLPPRKSSVPRSQKWCVYRATAVPNHVLHTTSLSVNLSGATLSDLPGFCRIIRNIMFGFYSLCILQTVQWLEILQRLCLHDNMEVQHRGLVIVYNMLSSDDELAKKLIESEILEILTIVGKQEDHPKRQPVLDAARACLSKAMDLGLIKPFADGRQ